MACTVTAAGDADLADQLCVCVGCAAHTWQEELTSQPRVAYVEKKGQTETFVQYRQDEKESLPVCLIQFLQGTNFHTELFIHEIVFFSLPNQSVVLFPPSGS